MNEIQELKKQVAAMQAAQVQQAATDKINRAWDSLAGDAPAVLKSAAAAELSGRVIRELMDQQSVDSQVKDFLERPDVRALVKPGESAAESAVAEAPATESRKRKPTFQEMLQEFKSGNAKLKLG